MERHPTIPLRLPGDDRDVLHPTGVRTDEQRATRVVSRRRITHSYVSRVLASGGHRPPRAAAACTVHSTEALVDCAARPVRSPDVAFCSAQVPGPLAG
eukprot:1262921-Prymnesium_polylepis.2